MLQLSQCSYRYVATTVATAVTTAVANVVLIVAITFVVIAVLLQSCTHCKTAHTHTELGVVDAN